MTKYLLFFVALGYCKCADCHSPLPWMDTLRIAACLGAQVQGVEIRNDTTYTVQAPGGPLLVIAEVIEPDTSFVNVDICAGDFYDGVPWFEDAQLAEWSNSIQTGCDSLTIFLINIVSPQGVQIAGDTLLCSGGQTTLNAGNYVSYAWSTGATTASITVTTPGTYGVEVRNSFGCVAESSLTIQLSEPLLTALANSPECADAATGVLQLTANGGFPPFHLISEAAFFTDTYTLTNLPAGDYSIEVVDAAGCTASTTAVLTAPPVLEIELPETLTILPGETQVLMPVFSEMPTEIRWSPGSTLSCTDCPEPTASPDRNTLYRIEAYDANGCRSVDSILIVLDTRRRVFIPNAFSPNGDGYNDFFAIAAGPGVSALRDFYVFNRWGAVVFKAVEVVPNAPETAWDGFFRGKACDPGSYAYRVSATFTDGQTEVFSGDITLVR